MLRVLERSCVLAVAVSLAACAGLAPEARADYYRYDWTQEITERSKRYTIWGTGEERHGYEVAYKGPRVIVRGSTTNSDTYECPGVDSVSSWMAVADDPDSASRSFTSASTAAVASQLGGSYLVTTTNWSADDINIRVVSSCTNDWIAYPYFTKSLVEYLEDWVAGLLQGTPDWVALVVKSFAWFSSASRASSGEAPVQAERAGNVFRLRDGTNRLALSFRQSRHSRRPPAIYLATNPSAADCRARRLHVPVIDGSGAALIELRCHGLKRGATARVTIRKGIRRTFPLHEGKGTMHIRLDKPPGTVEPLVHLSTRPSNAPCRTVRHRLRLTRTTMDLRLAGRCGRAARDAVGALYVGGLLAAGSDASG